MITKDYTKLFITMYNVANHIAKNYDKIITSAPEDFELNGYKFELLSSSKARCRYGNADESVLLMVKRCSVEYEYKKYVRISYMNKDELESYYIVKDFQDEGNALYYMYGPGIEKTQFPISRDLVFNINLSAFPITMDLRMYNIIKDGLDLLPFNLIFHMDEEYHAF